MNIERRLLTSSANLILAKSATNVITPLLDNIEVNIERAAGIEPSLAEAGDESVRPTLNIERDIITNANLILDKQLQMWSLSVWIISKVQFLLYAVQRIGL